MQAFHNNRLFMFCLIVAGCASTPAEGPEFLGRSAAADRVVARAYELILEDGRFPCLNPDTIDMQITKEVVEHQGGLMGSDRWTITGCGSTNHIDVTYTSDAGGDVQIDLRF